jgi:predicted alpha/beta hydrolase family esterase
MKQKQQILFIHGGEPNIGYKKYLDRLEKGRFELTITESKKWYKNLRNLITQNNSQVITPSMPNPENAHYSEWKIWFERHSEFLRDDIILVGHSLGGNFLAKYLAEESFDTKIKQLHLVAASHSAFEDDFKIQEFPGKLLNKKISEVHIYHSQDDLVVLILESEKYHAQIPQSHFHVFEDRGHFLGETFPELFKNIIN